MRLFLHLQQWFMVALYTYLLVFVSAVTSDDGWFLGAMTALVVGAGILNARANREAARAIGLTASVITRYGRWLAVYYTVLVVVGASIARSWWLIVIAAATLAWKVLWWKEAPLVDRGPARDLLVGSPGNTDFGHMPVTPMSQLVIRPIARMWLFVVLAYAVLAGIGLGVESWWEGSIDVVIPIAIFVTIFSITFLMGTVGDSLREFLTLGGARAEWARAVMLASLIAPAFGLLIDLAVWWRYETFSGLAFLVFVLYSTIATGLEIASKRNWLLVLLLAALGLALFTVVIVSDFKGWPLAVAGIGLYALWALLLPVLARRADPFASGASKWLGIRS